MLYMEKQALIIIPTYNEIGNIGLIIPAVLNLSNQYHILIVDDGSPDGTALKVKELQSAYDQRLHLIERESKLGLGTAYIEGFKFGIKHQFDYILEMDADFSHSPTVIPQLINTCEQGADMTVGSRYTKGGGIKEWGLDRLFLSYTASLFVRLITRLPVKDTTAGFVCYKKEVLQAINLDNIKAIGYGFQIEMKYTAYRLGFNIAEIPITFKEREFGQSKMNSRIISEAFLSVIRLPFRKY